MPLVVDAHEDLAWNALTFGRDYSRSAQAIRQAESSGAVPRQNGNALLGLDDYLRGNVAIIFGTLYATPLRYRFGDWDKLHYKDAAQAHKIYAQQLDYYERLAEEHPQFKLVNTRKDLESVLATWSPMSPDVGRSRDASRSGSDQRQVGIVRLMEGADCIRDPKEVEWWVERGVRIIGPAWSATRYSGGTREPGPLPPDGRRLLAEMANFRLLLDLSHASAESYFETLECYEGTVIVSHANPRALLKAPAHPERFLSDDMIRRLAERGGVMGIVPYNRFLKAAWRLEDGKNALRLKQVVAMIDHVCQLTGSAGHVGLGSDFDGGFGVECVPAEIDTVADLPLIGEELKEWGYAGSEVEQILSGNWIRILRTGLPIT